MYKHDFTTIHATFRQGICQKTALCSPDFWSKRQSQSTSNIDKTDF